MTPNDILTDIRSAISDESSVRWTDATLRIYMFDGETAIVNVHPEAQYGTRVVNSTPALLSANTASFTVSDSYRSAMFHYVAFRVFGEDSEDAANAALSKHHFQLFQASMGG